MRSTLALLSRLCLLLPTLAHADAVYKYVEQDGTVIYTNVPPPAAKRATRLKGTFSRAPKPSEPPAQRATPEQYLAWIDGAANRYNLPPALVRAIMHAESNFDPRALSSKGASGLMQLMPGTAEAMFVKDIFDARDNIEGGTRYLRVLANRFDGDLIRMIAAYNAGPEAVARYGGQVPPYFETQAYVKKVLQLYYRYKERSALARSE